MKEFTIVESKWARGGRNGASLLLNDNGNMCCLGFLCLSEGLERGDIEYLSLPSGVKRLPESLRPLTEYPCDERHQRLQNRIAGINDNLITSDEDRKMQLEPLFKQIGFVPVYVP